MKVDKSNPLAVFLGIGFEIAALIIAAIYLGDYLDSQFGWKGRGAVVLIVLSTIGWMFHVYILLRQLNQRTSEKK